MTYAAKYCTWFPIIALCLTISGIGSALGTKVGKVIIDTDGGADDAAALLLALQHEKLAPGEMKILAITCVYGNTNLTNAETNVLKILTVANRTDIPVYSGARKPLLENSTSDEYFGKDGLGDFTFKQRIIAKLDRSKHAVMAMIDLVKQYPGEISIISLGPLTNIALAISLDSTFSSNVKKYYMMGGSVKGNGNLRPNVEFNFGLDPESNFIVFNSTVRTPTTLIPWETALRYAVAKDWRRFILGSIHSPIVKFLNLADRIGLRNGTKWMISDSLAVGAAIWPDLILDADKMNVNPVTDGAARGSLLVDYANATGRVKNTIIIHMLEFEAFIERMRFYFS